MNSKIIEIYNKVSVIEEKLRDSIRNKDDEQVFGCLNLIEDLGKECSKYKENL